MGQLSVRFGQAVRGWLKVGTLGAALLLPQVASAETLADALIEAYRNSNLLDQNRAVLRAADEDVATAISALRPVISFSASGTYGRYSGSDQFAGSLGLTGQLTLLDFGRNKAAIAAAKASVLATRQALVNVEQDVLLSAVQAYVLVLQQQATVDLRQANVRVITQELQAAQDRFDVGETTRTDVAIADAALAAAQSLLVAAQGDLIVARENYKLAVGRYPNNLSVPPSLPATARNLEEARAVALRKHPTILQLQQQVLASEANVRLAEANMGPTLDATATIRDGSRTTETQTLGLSLNQTLYSGGRNSALYRLARAQLDATRAQLQQSSAIISQAVGQAWANLSVAQASIVASDRQIKSAQTALDGVREEAKLGARTTLDVLNADQDLLDARNNRLQAVATRYFGVYALLSTMGLLTVDHLGLGIPTYDPEAYYNAVKNAPATSSRGKKLDRVMKAIGN